MREYTSSAIVDHPSCIVLPQCDHHFEIKPSTLSILPIFNGMPSDNPYDHIAEFEQVCTTVQLNGLTPNGLKLKLFPFTLKHYARQWLRKLPPRSIRTWVEMQETFLGKYYPPSRTSIVRDELIAFREQPLESFHECWERFKDLEMSCPHGFLLTNFIEGCCRSKDKELTLLVVDLLQASSPMTHETHLRSFLFIGMIMMQGNNKHLVRRAHQTEVECMRLKKHHPCPLCMSSKG